MLIFLISAAVTVFLLVIAVLVMLTGRDPVEARLMEVSAYTAPDAGTLIAATPSTGLARVAAQITSLFKPFRGLVSGFDRKASLAGGGNRCGNFLRQQHGNCGPGRRGRGIFSTRSCSLILGDSPPNQYQYSPARCARFARDLHGSRTWH